MLQFLLPTKRGRPLYQGAKKKQGDNLRHAGRQAHKKPTPRVGSFRGRTAALFGSRPSTAATAAQGSNGAAAASVGAFASLMETYGPDGPLPVPSPSPPPIFRKSATFCTRASVIWEMCTRPSLPGRMLTKAPKSARRNLAFVDAVPLRSRR